MFVFKQVYWKMKQFKLHLQQFPTVQPWYHPFTNRWVATRRCCCCWPRLNDETSDDSSAEDSMIKSFWIADFLRSEEIGRLNWECATKKHPAARRVKTFRWSMTRRTFPHNQCKVGDGWRMVCLEHDSVKRCHTFFCYLGGRQLGTWRQFLHDWHFLNKMLYRLASRCRNIWR